MSFNEGKNFTSGSTIYRVWGEEDSLSGLFTPIAPDLAIHPYDALIHVYASDVNDPLRPYMHVEIGLTYSATENQMIISKCDFTGETWFGGLKVSNMHKLPIERIVKDFPPDLYVIDDGTPCGILGDWDAVLSKVPFSEYREQGPCDNTLKWVARIYYVAQLFRESPAKSVSERFDIPMRTASHWVKLMKERVWPESIMDRNVEDLEQNFSSLKMETEEDIAQRFYRVTGVDGE